MNLRIVVLVSHPVQYYVPLYRAMSRNDGINLMVLYHCRMGLDSSFDAGFGRQVSWDIPLLEGYQYQFLTGGTDLDRFKAGVLSAIFLAKPDVILVHGYDKPTNMAAIVFARLLGIPVLIRSDTKITDENRYPGLLKRMAKRVLFNAASGFIAIGTRNQEFYLWNGVQKDRIYFAPFSVDNRFFFTSEAQRPALRSHTRAALGIGPDDCVLLSSSKLIPIKQVKDLVIACAQLAPRCPSLRLLIVGSGEQEQSLRDLAEQLGFSKVTFAGFRNQSELPGIYAASDIFGLASRVEPWGLAVNEAMASGLPCIVSDRVGCAVDLVSEKGTGEVYPCGDLGKLMQAIARYAEDSAERKAASERALALIAHWDNSVCADKMIEACRAVAA